jgi:uncharacterized protein YgbK (DUF1537 family)
VSIVIFYKMMAARASSPSNADPGRRESVRTELRRSHTKIAVIDDDPTGSQVVADVPVVAAWADNDLDWAIRESDTAFVVLTNSRALDERGAVELNREIGLQIARRGRELGIDVRCISRSDSTLRGHFPAEVNGLIAGLRQGGQEVDGVLLCPAFLQAGRVTIEDVHYVRGADGLTPVAETEFAADSTFGYRSSNLREWAVERGAPADAIDSLSLATIRTRGPAGIAEQLLRARARLTVANAEAESDLDSLVLGLAEAERQGLRMVYRTGPSFVGARCGQELPATLSTEEIAPAAGPGLLVVGSHTALTTRQLTRALAEHDVEMVELRVDRLGTPGDEVARTARDLASALRRGDAGVMTSRAVLRYGDPAAELELGRRVAGALVDVVAAVPESQPVGWIVAKGGITSSDVATRALDAQRATVLGQIFPGLVSVWRLDDTSRRPGVPYVVFPGNVGADGALAATIARLKGR